MSIIEALYEYFSNCPLLNKDSKLNVDFLPDEAVEYSIDSVPCETVLRRYVNGNTKRQYLFVFASKEFYSEDAPQNIENLAFYEKLEKWIEEQSNKGILPFIGLCFESEKMKVLSSGYAFNTETKAARYQIQCQLIYTQEVN